MNNICRYTTERNVRKLNEIMCKKSVPAVSKGIMKKQRGFRDENVRKKVHNFIDRQDTKY